MTHCCDPFAIVFSAGVLSKKHFHTKDFIFVNIHSTSFIYTWTITQQSWTIQGCSGQQ